nr:FecR domain-containing protein [Deltaproteobacteria bacterium]
MSRHIKPQRWADAFAGKLPEAERTAMNEHAASCTSCARARQRVRGASDTFGTIRAQPAPELPWDSVRARVHWSVSKEKRTQAQPPRRRVPNLAWVALAAATAVGALSLVTTTDGPRMTHQAPLAESPRPVTAPPKPETEPVALPAALAGLVVRTAGSTIGDDVMIDGVLPTDLFARRLGAGTVIATGDGRVDVQFGDASAFGLGPRSTLELRRFDAKLIELVVDGTIDLEVAPRLPGQRFVVIAGDHTIEVRGTRFRVERNPQAITIECRHGLVAVRDRTSQVEVGTARRMQVATGAPITADLVVPLSVVELAALSEADPVRVPMWNLDALVTGSAPLEIASVGRRDIRVDGIELGRAPLRVRVMPGRHTVEAADSAGRFRRAGWIDVPAPTESGKPARLELPIEAPRTAGTAERRRQLLVGIDQA